MERWRFVGETLHTGTPVRQQVVRVGLRHGGSGNLGVAASNLPVQAINCQLLLRDFGRNRLGWCFATGDEVQQTVEPLLEPIAFLRQAVATFLGWCCQGGLFALVRSTGQGVIGDFKGLGAALADLGKNPKGFLYLGGGALGAALAGGVLNVQLGRIMPAMQPGMARLVNFASYAGTALLLSRLPKEAKTRRQMLAG